MEPTLFAALTAAAVAVGLALPALRPAWVVGHPWLVIGVVALLSVAAAVPLVRLEPLGLNLRIDPSTEPLLPAGDPAQEVYRAAVRNFGDDEVFVIAMEADDLFTAEGLGRLRRITDAIDHLPEVRTVQSLTDVVAFRFDREADWLDIADFIEEIPTDPRALAAIRAEALADPLYARTILSEDGRTAAINVTFRKQTDEEFIRSKLDARILEIVRAEIAEGTHLYVAGRPHVKNRVYEMMLRDMGTLIPLALLVVAAGLYVAFGTRRGVVLPMGTILLATLWTFGAIAFLERPLTVLTTLLAPMLAAIGSVYGIHAVTRYEEEVEQASSPAEAALRSLEHMRLPVTVAGLTTMIGFAALLITDVPAVFEVGAFAVFGVAAITVLTLTVVQAALALMPLRHAGSGTAWAAGIARNLDWSLERLASLAARRAGTWLLAFGLMLVAFVAAIPSIEIDTDYLSFFDEEAPVRQDFEAVNRLLAGAVPLFVSFESEIPGAFREPALLREIERLQEQASRIPGVGRTLSMVDTVRVMNRAMAKDDPREERIPDTRGAAAELLFMTPKGHLDRYANVNHSRANVMVRTGAVGTAEVRAVTGQLEAIVAEMELPEGVTAAVTGNALLLSHSADGIARGQPRTVGLAAIAIFVLISLSFGSVRLGAVAMLPNLVPVAIYFGILGFGAAPLSLPTSLIGSVALGIAIDDTVHFLVRYGGERRRGASPEEAAATCGRRIGRPIAITSLMLMAGFLVLALSGFATLRQFGVLSAVTMGICLVNDLILLPALLVRTRA
ncbi:MAG: RND family transporter [bacterium]|nr:RND family transporter [bacterium]